MPKRIYNPKNRALFQYKEGGNFYAVLGDREFSLKTNDQKLAIQRLEFERASTNRYGAEAYRATFGRLYPRYLEFLGDQVRRKKLRESYVAQIDWCWNRYFRDSLEKVKLAEMDQLMWDTLCSRIGRQYNVNSFGRLRSTVTGLMYWAKSKGLTLFVPELQNPDHKERERRVLPDEHIKLIFQYLEGGVFDFATIALFTGMRRSEITKLKWAAVHFEASEISLSREDTKTKQSRRFPFGEEVRHILTRRLREQQEGGVISPFVFPNKRNVMRPMDPSGFKLKWKAALKKAGFIRSNGEHEYTWHDLRATFETWMHRTPGFTDTQYERMVGASVRVQRDRYTKLTARDLKGLESVVQVPGLKQLIASRGDSSHPGKKVGK